MPGAQGAPRVAVLLATRNGRAWLPEQLAGILGQEGVEVRVVVRDDDSSDGTRDWLGELGDPRVELRADHEASGSAAANFYRLLEGHQPAEGEYTAFADQDDVWLPGKLARAVERMREESADGFSSDVIAFHADGREYPLGKARPQRAFDFLLESPGPGSTFVLSPRLVALVREVLATRPEAHEIDYHDWLVYAIARSRGWRWVIDELPLLRYRQHEANAMGANSGAAAARSRLALIRSRWHREQARRLAGIGASVAPTAEARDALEAWAAAFADGGPRGRWRVIRGAGSLRRRPRDRVAIAALTATGVW
ncbi:MAG: glycosyltransferase [Actinomycetales bacterium]|nr:glycosyltransferase [Actinomycetales bacterium]